MELEEALFLDIECPRDGGPISRVGILRPGRRGVELTPNAEFGARLSALAKGAKLLCGHNLRRHDLPRLRERWPDLPGLALPAVDTLELSPLAFPRRPYHHLVKDYKLVTDARNDPVRDCELTATLLADEILALAKHPPGLVRVLRRLFPDSDPAFARAGAGARAGDSEVLPFLASAGILDRTCGTVTAGIPAWLASGATGPEDGKALGYALAWILVAEGDSILPPWVFHVYPEAAGWITRLRGSDCGRCAYCRSANDTSASLRRFFGFHSLRPPQAPVVEDLVSGKNLLAVLPTSGGKSLCFQLPAMIRAHREKLLTVVISPLQALMKDQVDVLRSRFRYPHVAALYGGLTAPERKEVRDGVLSGRYDLLYAAPEQLRNKSFLSLIRQRRWGMWVIDEAHCLSKWGHDFRPDYLHIPRLLWRFTEKEGRDLPQLAFFTATAKPEVVEEIVDLFGAGLGLDVGVRSAGVERPNLSYEVLAADEDEKPGRLVELIRSAGGATIAYCSTRRRTERFADLLRAEGLRADAYHAGRIAEKRDIQDAFVRGDLDCVVATNAFGMGVDKSDVRLVVHVDMPGSLESYLQEAGRAGRDDLPARCVLLFNVADVDSQFRRDREGRLTRADVAAVFKAVRNRDRKIGGRGEVVMTAGEILRGAGDETSLDPGARDAATKVRVAISILEDSSLVRRLENEIRVWQIAFRFANMSEARGRVESLRLPSSVAETWLTLLGHLVSASAAGHTSFDSDLVSDATGIPIRQLAPLLRDMTTAGLLEADARMSAVFAKNVAGNARVRFGRVTARQRAMLALMEEESPNAEPGAEYSLSLRRICSGVRTRLEDSAAAGTPEDALDAVEDFARDGLLRFRQVGKDQLTVALLAAFPDWRPRLDQRDSVAHEFLELLHARSPAQVRSKNVRVEFSFGDLERVDPSALESALLFLHRNRVIFLENGLGLFRSAMRLALEPGRNLNDLKTEGLDDHYRQKTAQVHVMAEYARRARALGRTEKRYVEDYFRLSTSGFLAKYFPHREDEIAREVTPELYRRIVTELAHPAQEEIVRSRAPATLVLAGPGSGKTRTILHRVAYLVNVRRVPPERILVVAYNRQAVLKVRRGLRELMGRAGAFVDVYTFHGLALFLTGSDFDLHAGGESEDPFAEMIERAIRLLQPGGGDEDPSMTEDERRARILRGYEHVLVDEYQDIDAAQYQLVSLIADRGRRGAGRDAVNLLVVGDDDQNIYEFRKSDVAFIRRFEDDYGPKPHYLLENYRSTKHIIAVTNHVIAKNPDRLKVAGYEVRVNESRALEPAGGRYERTDPVDQGRVLVLSSRDREEEARGLLSEIGRLRQLPGGLAYGGIAVLARAHQDLLPLASLLRAAHVPHQTFAPPGFPLLAVREVIDLLAFLRGLDAGLRPAEELLAKIDGYLASRPMTGAPAERIQAILAAFRREFTGVEVPADTLAEHIFESSRRGGECLVPDDRLVLATMHAAKGLEFDQVFVLSSAFRGRPAEEAAERRLHYVAATRARRGLCLLSTEGLLSPLVRDLTGLDESRISRRAASVPEEILRLPIETGVREEVLGLGDVWMAYPARIERAATCQRVLAGLPTGAPLELDRREHSGKVRHYLLHAGHRVGRLSERASARLEADPAWRVQSVRVHAVVRCRRSDRDQRVETDNYWTIVPEITLLRV